MNTILTEKLARLKKLFLETKGCAVAFSGGVDSTLVITVAHEVLGDRALAVIATSSTYPQREFRQAVDFVENRGIPYTVLESEELDIPEFSNNPVDRCYYCKRELFEKVAGQARKHDVEWVADGTNADDVGDYRPGMKAARELGVISPLLEAGLTKQDIRDISREVYDLPTAGKPAMACLASRFPYGSSITRDKLSQVETIETFLENKGFSIFRARHHGDILRLELGEQELKLIQDTGLRKEIADFIRTQGFTYAAIDMDGYRTGSMNETIDNEQRNN